jgi:glycosyltransferase involved in cell wall biosynthesis
VQSTHFFANLYAAILGSLCNALPIGSIRNDGRFDVQANGRRGRWLLTTPPLLLANSWAAQRNVQAMGVPGERLHVLANVIDLAAFDRAWSPAHRVRPEASPVALVVCRLVVMKRVDRFIRALERARQVVPALRGVIAGDGPEREPLQALARSMPGLNGALTFAGRIDDVPGLMRTADMLLLSSDHEGFPNVVLEAMAARLPVIATPAGDVSRLVEHGETGYVVPLDDVDAMADQMVRLATDPALGTRLGQAGRARVEQSFTFTGLGERLLSIYTRMAEARRQARTLGALQARHAA